MKALNKKTKILVIVAAVLVVLFLIGTVGGAIQAMKYLEHRQRRLSGRPGSRPKDKPSDPR